MKKKAAKKSGSKAKRSAKKVDAGPPRQHVIVLTAPDSCDPYVISGVMRGNSEVRFYNEFPSDLAVKFGNGCPLENFDNDNGEPVPSGGFTVYFSVKASARKKDYTYSVVDASQQGGPDGPAISVDS